MKRPSKNGKQTRSCGSSGSKGSPTQSMDINASKHTSHCQKRWIFRTLSIMKKTLLILFTLLALVGCSQQSPQPPTLEINNILRSDFATEFDRLFLSNEPLRYQDNVAFLDAIPVEELSSPEKDLLKTKLKLFLSLQNQDREYTPDSAHTGVASEIAFLRLQAVQVLAEVGTKNDVEFIQNLETNPEGEHPLFETECKKTIEKLNDS